MQNKKTSFIDSFVFFSKTYGIVPESLSKASESVYGHTSGYVQDFYGGIADIIKFIEKSSDEQILGSITSDNIVSKLDKNFHEDSHAVNNITHFTRIENQLRALDKKPQDNWDKSDDSNIKTALTSQSNLSSGLKSILQRVLDSTSFQGTKVFSKSTENSTESNSGSNLNKQNQEPNNFEYLDSKKHTIKPHAKSVTEKIRASLRARIINPQYEPEFMVKLAEFYKKPVNLNLFLRNVAKTCDSIWVAAGDRSLDFNYYSKRGLLILIYLNSYRTTYNNGTQNIEMGFRSIDKGLEMVKKINIFKNTLSVDNIPFLRLFKLNDKK
ncbi:MAG: hypothetical protein SFT93_01440 [Rickettsiaceae bacterium]|nr:hypothetical protein [Rickettsiaceae bacterium]